MNRVAFVVEVDPGLGAINGRAVMRQRGRGGAKFIGKSAAYIAYADAVARAAGRLCCSSFAGGVLGCAVTFYAKNRRHLGGLPGGFALADLDVDASIKATLDGMQAGGLLDDDVRIAELHVRKRVDPARPRVAIAIWTLPPPA